MNIAFRAAVVCVDGPAGQCSHVIVAPATFQVTHLVVQGDGVTQNGRLVPFDRVIDVIDEVISLACTRKELATMEGFVERTYLTVSVPDYHEPADPLFMSGTVLRTTRLVAVDARHVPAHELAIDRLTTVEAIDGKAGLVDELAVEPVSGRITGLVMRVSRLFSSRDVAVPAVHIGALETGAVHLKLDRRSVEALPAPSPAAAWAFTSVYHSATRS